MGGTGQKWGRAGGAAACPGTTPHRAAPRLRPAGCHTNLGEGQASGAESTATAGQTAAPASRGVFTGSAPPKTLARPSGSKH